MNNFKVIICAFFILTSSVCSMDTDTTRAEKMVYVCEDAGNLCISMDKDGCKDCSEIKEKQYTLSTFMQTVKQVSKELKSAIKSFDREKIASLARVADFISDEIPNFDPQINIEKKKEYSELAQVFGMRASDMAAASEKGDQDVVIKHFRSFTKTCSACHDTFRN